MNRELTWLVLTVVLAAAVLLSSLGVVYAKHQARKAFVELQNLSHERDELSIDWGRLRLEQSTWGTHGRIEHMATEDLAMVIPEANEIVIVTP